MPIIPEAVGAKGEPRKRSWTSKDALLYAVGIGAGTEELQYTTENTYVCYIQQVKVHSTCPG